MTTFRFDLVSPEKLLFSGEVNQVDVPGAEGEFGVLAGHAPLVNGGFAEVGANGLTVLADMAVPEEEFDRAVLAGVIKDTEEDAADTTDDWQRDKLTRKLEQLKALQAALGG